MIMWAKIIRVSPQYGALVVYAGYSGRTITIESLDGTGQEYYADTKAYESNNKTIYAAVFPALPPGNYYIRYSKKVTVFPGAIAEVYL